MIYFESEYAAKRMITADKRTVNKGRSGICKVQEEGDSVAKALKRLPPRFPTQYSQTE